MGKTPTGKNTSGRGQRDLKVKVKSARGRTTSSTRWLQRQLNDPYVKRAKAEGYRGRAAFKIMELDDKYRFLVPGARIVDLGAAPGGWCQVAVKRSNILGEKGGKAVGTILAIDLQEMEPIAGCEIHQLDFMEDDADLKVKQWLGGKADVVMSDMAASSSGHKQTDHLRIIALCEAAAYFAFDVLEDGGTFIAKTLAGGRGRVAKTAETALSQSSQLQTTLKPSGQFGEVCRGDRVSGRNEGRRRLSVPL